MAGPPSPAGLPSFRHLVGAPHALRVQADQGQVLPGNTPGHRDSWGIGWFDDAGRVSLVRQTGSAIDSAYYIFGAEAAARASAGSNPARILIGHLRKAVSGAVTSDNAHPIRVDTEHAGPFLLAHNGHVREPLLESLRRDLDAAGDRGGARADCDTVVLAHWLAAQLDPDADHRGLAPALQDLLRRAEALENPYEAYTGLNLLAALPDGLAVLRHFSRYGDYYTLWHRDDDDGNALIASERTDDSPQWGLLTPGVLSFFGTDRSAPRRWKIADPA